jgi:hypothetical protein
MTGIEPLFCNRRDIGRGAAALNVARQLIGRRIRWPGDNYGGIITDITTTRNGYMMFVVEWDDDVPDWYGTEVSPRSSVEVADAE